MLERHLPVPVVHEAHVAAAADDDVVEDADADEVADFAQAAGDLQVLLRWCRVTAYAELCISGVMRRTGLCGVDRGGARLCEGLLNA